MLSQFGPSTIVAIMVGFGLAVVGFLPVVAHRYRKAGRLRAWDLVLLLAVASYAVALWSYTLIPLPETADFRCVAANLQPGQVLADIRSARAQGAGWRHNRALLQAVFNVVFFLPFGGFIRLLFRRGVVVATFTGFATSLLIELTQKTGIWGIYRCAYRTFDVDDLMLNTGGALLGSLLIFPVVWAIDRKGPPPQVTTVRAGRRLVGMFADLMATALIGFTAAVLWRGSLIYLVGLSAEELPVWADQLWSTGLPLLVEAVAVFGTGRTLGEAIVSLRPVLPAGAARLPRLAVKFLFGVGGYLLLTLQTDGLLSLGFAAVSVIAVFGTDDRRGLSHLAAGMRLNVAGVPPEDRPPHI